MMPWPAVDKVTWNWEGALLRLRQIERILKGNTEANNYNRARLCVPSQTWGDYSTNSVG